MWQPKPPPGIAKIPHGGKITLAENHWDKMRLHPAAPHHQKPPSECSFRITLHHSRDHVLGPEGSISKQLSWTQIRKGENLSKWKPTGLHFKPQAKWRKGENKKYREITPVSQLWRRLIKLAFRWPAFPPTLPLAKEISPGSSRKKPSTQRRGRTWIS